MHPKNLQAQRWNLFLKQKEKRNNCREERAPDSYFSWRRSQSPSYSLEAVRDVP
jgi:hypothetical protein